MGELGWRAKSAQLTREAKPIEGNIQASNLFQGAVLKHKICKIEQSPYSFVAMNENQDFNSQIACKAHIPQVLCLLKLDKVSEFLPVKLIKDPSSAAMQCSAAKRYSY